MWRILSLSLCFTHILHSLSVHVGCILLFHTFCLSIPLKHIKLYNYLSLSLTQTFKKRKKSFINFHFFVFFQNNLSLTPLSLSLSLIAWQRILYQIVIRYYVLAFRIYTLSIYLFYTHMALKHTGTFSDPFPSFLLYFILICGRNEIKTLLKEWGNAE